MRFNDCANNDKDGDRREYQAQSSAFSDVLSLLKDFQTGSAAAVGGQIDLIGKMGLSTAAELLGSFEPTLVLDVSKLHDSNSKTRSEMPADPPFVASFKFRDKGRDKELDYIASSHVRAKEDHSKLFGLIDEELGNAAHPDGLKQSPPDVVILEGFGGDLSDGYKHPPANGKYASEGHYAGFQAWKQGTKALGGDMTDSEQCHTLIGEVGRDGNKYTAADYVQFAFLRLHGESGKEEQLGKPLEDLYPDFVKKLAGHLKTDGVIAGDEAKNLTGMKFEDFRGWYLHNVGHELAEAAPVGAPDAKDRIDHKESAPGADNPHRSNQISVILDRAGNAHTAKVIKDALESHDRVLVIHGANHYMESKELLEAMLGSPAIDRR